MDKPLNNGFVCSKHKIGYIKKCPTCAFEEQEKARKDLIKEFVNEACDRNDEALKKLSDSNNNELEKHLNEALEEVELKRQGKLPRRNAKEMIKEIKEEVNENG